jgi:hypothetical protein
VPLHRHLKLKDDGLVVQHRDESRYNLPDRHGIAIEHLEGRITIMLAEAERGPSKNTPLFNREIDRLDYQLELLRLNATQDGLVGQPFPVDQD